MHWKRIAFFVVVGFIVTAAAAFPFGFLAALAARWSEEALLVSRVGAAVAVPVASTLTLGVLAFIQRERVAAHVYTTAFLMWAGSFVPNVLLLGQPAWQWLAGAIVSGVCATIALGLAVVFQRMVAVRQA